MPVILVILILVLIGAIVMAVNRYGGGWIHPWWIQLINIVAIVGTIWFLLVATGAWDYLWTIRLPHR